jgi:hypothetical protein
MSKIAAQEGSMPEKTPTKPDTASLLTVGIPYSVRLYYVGTSSHLELRGGGWLRLLDAAWRNGWEPQGAVQLQLPQSRAINADQVQLVIPRGGFVLGEHEAYPNGYLRTMRCITQEDAQALAAALAPLVAEGDAGARQVVNFLSTAPPLGVDIR